MEKKCKWKCIPPGSFSKILLRMKLLAFFVLITMVTTAANTYSQQTKFKLNLNGVTVREVFQEIEDKSEFILLYNEKQLDANRKVSVKADNETVESILNQVFEGTQNTYKIYDRQIVILSPDMQELPNIIKVGNEVQQKKDVTGTVKSNDGQPIPGATVVVKGTSSGTITDTNGKFVLPIPENAQTLVFSFVGMKTQEVPIGNQTIFNVVLREEEIGLDEVVVVGYGTQKKANLTGSVDQVTSDALENRSMSNLTQGLKGMVPNLNIRILDGKPNQSPSYNIRGLTSIGQGGSALILIDGVAGDPAMINPNDIANISVLKDAASASIYGARGAFGVVLITTKNPSKGKTSITYSSNFPLQ
jgi:TonB-dependent SusC/RagA subfamily outer membrane receptor